MNNYYVYFYVNPKTKIPFYVGKGLNKRAFLFDKHNHNKSLLSYLKKLKNLGYTKEEIVLIKENNLSEFEALEKEKYFVKQYGKKNEGGLLFNIIDGGSQPPNQKNKRYKRSKETIENIKNSWTLERKLKMSLRIANKKRPKEWHDKISKTRRNKYIFNKDKFEQLVFEKLSLNKIMKQLDVKYDKLRDRLKLTYGTTSFKEIKKSILTHF
jgi:hypothetical protein